MKKEWFSTTELIGIGGLPTTVQGINQRAKREEWMSRKRSGVQGKAVEYHIDSLSEDVRHALLLKLKEKSYSKAPQDPLAVWVAMYHQFTPQERELLINLIMRKGISGLMMLLLEHEPDH